MIASAAVSSAVQLGASGVTGIGASGVVYALFGLTWTSRRAVPAFSQALGEKAAILFLAWLVGCFIVTRAGIMEVGNGAHVGGLLFGFLMAHLLVLGRRRKLALACTGLLVGLSIVPLFWSPWSSTWVGYRAYKAHQAGNYEAAIASYRRSIALGGDRLWALENLAGAYYAKGAEKEYVSTIAEIRVLDAKAAERIEAEIEDDTQQPE